MAKKHVTAGKKRISLEDLLKVLGLQSVKDAEGNIIQEAPLPIWENCRPSCEIAMVEKVQAPHPSRLSSSAHVLRSQTLIFLRLPQVDQECRDQIRNKWVAAPAATAKMPISMTAIVGIIPIKPKRADSCSQSEFQKAGRRHSRLARSLAKMRVPEGLRYAVCIPK